MNKELLFNINKGIFLLLLAVGSNYVAQTFSCKTQQLLTESMYAKHVMVLFIIYFAVGFTDETNTSPFQKLQITFLVWALFLMFTKMTPLFTIAAFVSFTLAYYIQTYIVYYKNLKDDKKYGKRITNLENIFYTLMSITILTIIFGFLLYFNYQYSERKYDWSTTKFLFGTTKCDSFK